MENPQTSMFDEPGADPGQVKAASPKKVAEFWLKRLRGVFEHVSPEGRILRNSRNAPLYLLCFAAGNPKGVKIMNSIFRSSTITTR